MKKSIYIFSEGDLRRRDNTLYLETEEGKKYLPIEDVKEIMAFGELSFNKKLLELLSQKEIILHYFNHYGYYMGTFYPREHLNSGYMILKQTEYYSDDEKRLEVAKAFVWGAYKNIRQVCKYYGNRGRAIENDIAAMESLSEKIEASQDIVQLMSVEAHIREKYYKMFDRIIQNKDFLFVERSRRPPRNALNALISFGNAIMYTMVLSEIYKTHLDPRIGYLHTTNFRRFTLNLDVAEIFKPILIDRLIFSLLDRKMLTKNDFEKDLGGIVLKERSRKLFVEELDKKLNSTITHRSTGRKVSYRRMIRLELYKLEKHFMGESVYEPFIAQW